MPTHSTPQAPQRKNYGTLLLLSGIVLGVFLLFGSFMWMQDKANMLLAVFVLILYGMGQWLTVAYWQRIQEDWENTGEILGRLQQAVTSIPDALDSNLKSIATRLAENQQKALTQLQAEVNEGARKTLETGAALIGESISSHFNQPMASLKSLLENMDARTRDQAQGILAMAEDAKRESAEAARRGAALIAESLQKHLAAPLATLQASLDAGQEKASRQAEGSRILWEELGKSQEAWGAKVETLADSLTGELKSIARQGAEAAEKNREAWVEQAESAQGAWQASAEALEGKVLEGLRGEASRLGATLAATSDALLARLESSQKSQAQENTRTVERVLSGLEGQVEALQGAALVFEDGLAKIRDASTDLLLKVEAKGEASRLALVSEFSGAQEKALGEAARLLEAQGQLGLEVAGKVTDLAERLDQGTRDLGELAHLSQINQAELQASVAMLNQGLASILERLEKQASAGDGYQSFLADLGRALSIFQERAAETLVDNALKTQEILMEVLRHADRKAAAEEGEPASTQAAIALT